MKIENKKYILWMIGLRLVVALTILISAFIIQFLTHSKFDLIIPLFWIVAGIFALSLIYSLLYQKMGEYPIFTYIQIGGDVLIITGLVYLTGGVDSSFSFLYLISIITAGTLLYRKGAYIIALFSTLCYGILVDLQFYSIIPYYRLGRAASLPPNRVYYFLMVNIVGFFLVAYLSSFLSSRLKKRGRELEEKSTSLADLQMLHQDVIASMRNGLITTDMEGNITFVNKTGEQILEGYEKFKGRDLKTLLGLPENAFEMPTPLGKNRFEKELSDSEDNSKVLSIDISPLLNREKTQIGYLVVFEDQTEVKELQRKLKIKDRMAVIGEMAAGIAHEIRNPLASMKGAIEMLEDELNLNEEQERLLKIVIKESVRLNNTVSNFLDFAREADYEPEKINLINVISETLTLLKHSQHYSENHKIELNYDGEGIDYFTDSHLISQLVWNISLNALESMPEGGELEIDIKKLQNGLEMKFSDSGKGIPEEELSHIFEPFRSDSENGLGLGLAIVYRIVEDLGGNIHVESEVDKGTDFIISLPSSSKSTEK